MGTGLGLAQFELGTPDHHFAAMVEEIGQRGLEVQQHGAVVHHGQHVDAERGFQRRVLVQRVDDDLGHGAALQLDDHADAPAVGLVAQVGHAVDLAVVDQRRDLFHKARLVQAERDLPDDQRLEALLAVLDLDLAAYLHGTAPGGVGVVQPLTRVDVAVGKSGPCTTSIRSSTELSGASMSMSRASDSSLRLCGGMFVAMPTAMPEEPFSNKLGTFVGRTTGSASVLS